MVSSCGRYVIAFNGEIYNFLELRKDLTGLGFELRGNSDTEVLLEAISHWGLEPTLSKSVGMFAFALWDRHGQKLFLVRDRLGKKPLYYMERDGALYFASEIKALKELVYDYLRMDESSVGHYLTCGYVPSPFTIYEDILEIPPAHYATWNNTLQSVCKPYWTVEWQPKIDVSFDQALEQTEALLQDAIRLRLVSDVPLGYFLSGGIDSGLCVALASQVANTELLTFTVRVDSEDIDESPLAKLVAERYGTRHHVLQVTTDLENDLPKVVAAYDDPFSDPSAIPTYLISREARRHVKVVINGDGGDEVFAGYRRHRAIFLFSRYRSLFSAIPANCLRLLTRVLPIPGKFRSPYAFLHRFLRGVQEDPFERYISWCVDGFDEKEKIEMGFNSDQNTNNSTLTFLAQKFVSLNGLDPIDHFMALDLIFNLPGALLVKMDIASMAHGLEARSPFLDHRLVEYASRLSSDLKLRGANPKAILRRIAKKYLPTAVANAPKRGFEIPLVQWLREDLFDMVRDVCLSPNGIVVGLLERKYVENLICGSHRLDPARWARRVWILFILGLWDQLERNG
jgi:asparagine synthase (glutamine-hydrolysing)